MVMKEKDPFDFSLVFVFKGTQEGFAVNEASVGINDGWRTGKPLERRESFGQ